MKSPNDKKRFLEALEEIPIVSIASKRTGIAKSTIYRWKDKDSKFSDKIEECLWRGRDCVTDKVESQLIKQATAGEFKPMKFWLESNCKRYVRPRLDNIFLNNDRLEKIIVEVLKTREITQKEKDEIDGKLEPTTIIFEDYNEKDEEEIKGS